MVNLVGSFPVARTTSVAGNIFSGGVFGVGRSSLITPLRQTRREELTPSNQVTLNLVSQQLVGFTRQMQDIGGALEKIAYYIAIDSSLEQKREQQKQLEEQKLAQEVVRDERENIIERKIKGALIAPVQAIAQKTQSILSRLMGFFSSLLLGWLLNQGIEAIKSNAEGAQNKLEEIKNNVFQALGVAYKIFAIIKGGFLAFARTITNIAFKVGKFLISGVIGGIFKGLANLAKGLFNFGKGLLGMGTTAAGAANAAGKVLPAAAKPASKGLGFLGRFIPGLSTAVNLGAAAYRFKAGDIPGAALSALSAVPLIGIPVAAVDVARDFGAFKGTFLENKQVTKEQQKAQAKIDSASLMNTQPPPTTTTPPPAAQPQTPITPEMSQYQFGVDTTGQFNNTFSGEDQDFTQEAMYGEMNVPMETESPTAAKITSLSVTQMQRTQQLAAPLPEPAPSVVMMRTQSQQAQDGGYVETSGPVNDVPAIATSNPENFYTLYAQMHYNIVV
jgi:hypothetical protein